MEEFKRFFYTGSADCRLSAVDFGNPEKPDVLIVHGMRDHAMSMFSLAEALSDNYHVIAMDMRGHGQSDNPGTYTMVQFVADVRSLILHARLSKVTLIAHSLGGHIAYRYTAMYPDEIVRLILLDGLGPPGIEAKLDEGNLLESMRNDVNVSMAVTTQRRAMKDASEALTRLTSNNPQLSKMSAQIIVDHGVEPHPDGGVQWCWDPAIHMVWLTTAHHENETFWRSVECPVLMVTGEFSRNYWEKRLPAGSVEEALYESTLQRRRKLFQNAQHQVVENAGHMLHYDQPEQVNVLVKEFLARTGG